MSDDTATCRNCGGELDVNDTDTRSYDDERYWHRVCPRTMQLDVAYADGETLPDVLHQLTHGTRVTTRVLLTHGPAGGWPLVEFTGTPISLLAVRQRYDDPRAAALAAAIRVAAYLTAQASLGSADHEMLHAANGVELHASDLRLLIDEVQ